MKMNTEVLQSMAANLVDAENNAISALETILANAGWSDGWKLRDSEVRSATNPLYYRNSAPVVASEARIKRSNQAHTLYCLYSITDNDIKYSDNVPGFYHIKIAVTLYYDEPFIFSITGFKPFLSSVIEALSSAKWQISSESEASVMSAEDGNKYLNRKVLFIEKTF